MLVSLSPKSRHHWIFESLETERFDLLVSDEILLEYEEIISDKYNRDAARQLLATLYALPNIHYINPYFHWGLIYHDPADDKFADCAIAGNADHLITEDRDFNVLKTLEFPRVSVLNISEFKMLLGIP